MVHRTHEQGVTVQTTAAFDSGAHQDTTRQQRQDAAETWHRWGLVLEDWLGAATDTMLDLANVRAGDRVLDVAAGAGGQTVAAAERVGAGGSVLALDISTDPERPDTYADTFDAVISRLGFIHLPNGQDALGRMHRALKPGRRLARIVYSTACKNEFLSITVAVIGRRAQLPAPAPGQPGPFRFGDPGAIESAFEQAGFEDIEAYRVAAPLRLASAADCVAFECESFGALHPMGADESGREDAWHEIEQELRRFEGPTGFVGPCELIVAAGTKPRTPPPVRNSNDSEMTHHHPDGPTTVELEGSHHAVDHDPPDLGV